MKVLIPILIGLLVVGCGEKQSTNTNESSNTPKKSAKKKAEKTSPSKTSLASFLPGKKIVFKVPNSSRQGMFIFEESGNYSMAVGTPNGFRQRDFPKGAYEIDGLEVELPDGDFLVFSSNHPKAGDTISVREPAGVDVDPSGPDGPGEAPEKPKSSEPKIVATFIIDKIIDADESVKFIDPKKSQAERNRMLKSIDHLRQMHASLPGADGYPAGWGDSLLKKWDYQDRLEIFLSPRLPDSEKLEAQLKAHLRAGNEIKKENRICHYAINKSMIEKSIFDVMDTADSTVLLFECELGWNGAGGLEDALKFMDKHQLKAIAVVMVRGDGKPVTREELKKLKW